MKCFNHILANKTTLAYFMSVMQKKVSVIMLIVVMLSGVMLSVVMLSVVMLSVSMLSVTAPHKVLIIIYSNKTTLTYFVSVLLSFGECCYAQCHYAQCCGTS
jgi:hypothetical protein